MCIWHIHNLASHIIYEARVHFGTRVPVPVLVRDSAIFEKVGCGCGGTRRLKNYLKYFYLYFLYIFTIKIFLKNTLLCLDSQNKERRRQETPLRSEFRWFRWVSRPISAVSIAGQYDPILAELAWFDANWSRFGVNRAMSVRIWGKKKKKLKCSNDAWATASDVASHVGRGCNTLSAASVLPSI